ncbi:UNVERIFIED_CONTAM: hypothetical protein OHV15_19720, partial [Microbacterium sp. SLM126]
MMVENEAVATAIHDSAWRGLRDGADCNRRVPGQAFTHVIAGRVGWEWRFRYIHQRLMGICGI